MHRVVQSVEHTSGSRPPMRRQAVKQAPPSSVRRRERECLVFCNPFPDHHNSRLPAVDSTNASFARGGVVVRPARFFESAAATDTVPATAFRCCVGAATFFAGGEGLCVVFAFAATARRVRFRLRLIATTAPAAGDCARGVRFQQHNAVDRRRAGVHQAVEARPRQRPKTDDQCKTQRHFHFYFLSELMPKGPNNRTHEPRGSRASQPTHRTEPLTTSTESRHVVTARVRPNALQIPIAQTAAPINIQNNTIQATYDRERFADRSSTYPLQSFRKVASPSTTT